MKIALILDNPAVHEAIRLAIVTLFFPYRILTPEAAELVIADNTDDLSLHLASGKYAIHYCCDETGVCRHELIVVRNHPHFRLALHHDEANGLVLVDCLRSIGNETGLMQMIE